MASDVIQTAEIKQLTLGKYTTVNLPDCADGTIMYDTTTNKLVIRASGVWKQVTSV